MTEGPIDHRSIAVQRFNDTWELISQQDRSHTETEEIRGAGPGRRLWRPRRQPDLSRGRPHRGRPGRVG